MNGRRRPGTKESMGINWTEDKLKRLSDLCLLGYTANEIALILTDEFNELFTYKSVTNAKYGHNISEKYLKLDKDIKIYEEFVLPEDDYMVSCDYHSPYHSELWVNRMIYIGEIFQIRKLIIIGDLFDFNFAKKWYSDEKTTLDDEIGYASPLLEALGFFDVIYMVQGNHETRVGRATDGKVQAKHLFRLFGPDVWDKKFKYSPYDKIRIADKWLFTHPKSYSQVSSSVARRLAEKYHMNIINSHGHFVGMAYDRSGRYLAVDLGGMFQINKIEYINMSTTTHPMWNNGFGMIRNGKFWHFTDATDWDFWSKF